MKPLGTSPANLGNEGATLERAEGAGAGVLGGGMGPDLQARQGGACMCSTEHSVQCAVEGAVGFVGGLTYERFFVGVAEGRVDGGGVLVPDGSSAMAAFSSSTESLACCPSWGPSLEVLSLSAARLPLHAWDWHAMMCYEYLVSLMPQVVIMGAHHGFHWQPPKRVQVWLELVFTSLHEVIMDIFSFTCMIMTQFSL